jgi:DNA adenine methylase
LVNGTACLLPLEGGGAVPGILAGVGIQEGIIPNMQTGSIVSAPISLSVKPAKPFMKWAGGKSQLIEALVNFFPPELGNGQIKKYVEPFIGGGALFFYVAQNYPSIESFFISDVNEELMLAYKTIQKDVESLISLLATLEKKYHSLDRPKQKEFFYQERVNFNKKLPETDFKNFHENWIERTATIIFLNRTCFNGLFRVNSKGEFNVPFGDYKNPKICDPDNLRAVSELLQRTQIECGDFTTSKEFVDENAFVYFDPPYRPISKTASFTSYSKFDFDEDEQKRLAEYFAVLSKKGAKLMLSNSDPKNENPQDHFFEDLYHEFHIERVDASRMINCDGNKRGKIKELVIMNY